MKFIPHALAALALAVSIMLAFVSWNTVDQLRKIDTRLDSIQSELTMLQSPTYQDRVFQERMARLLDLVRQRQEIALAHSE